MFNDPNSTNSIMNPYAHMIAGADVAARADARAKERKPGGGGPTNRERRNGKTLLDWARDLALATAPPQI